MDLFGEGVVTKGILIEVLGGNSEILSGLFPFFLNVVEIAELAGGAANPRSTLVNADEFAKRALGISDASHRLVGMTETEASGGGVRGIRECIEVSLVETDAVIEIAGFFVLVGLGDPRVVIALRFEEGLLFGGALGMGRWRK